MSRAGRPNIVIVVMDCVRAQNMPVYGCPTPTTPRISQLAAQAVRFDAAITAGEQTLSSTASLFTGMYPSSHGLRITGDKLGGHLVTLAEALQGNGYSTHCINCNNPYVSPFTMLQRGFDEYLCAFPAVRRWLTRMRGHQPTPHLDRARPAGGETPQQDHHDADAISRDAVSAPHTTWRAAAIESLRWTLTRIVDNGASAAFSRARRILRESRPDRPAFVYVHLMETHAPYLPPARHRGLFLPAGHGRKLALVNQDPLPFLTGAATMDALDFAIVEGLYNGSIHYTDHLFGAFFETLRRQSNLSDTIIILTADHGENFGDHGLLGHGQCVYDTVVRVPLLIWGPVIDSHMKGTVISEVVQNIDLTASCLDWSSTTDAKMREQMDSQPLPFLSGNSRPREHAISESLRLFDKTHRRVLQEMGLLHLGAIGARSKTHKLIHQTTGQEEFYDLKSDPGEEDNIIGRKTEEQEVLRSVLEPMIPKFRKSCSDALSRFEQADTYEVDPEVERRLRDLGYID